MPTLKQQINITFNINYSPRFPSQKVVVSDITVTQIPLDGIVTEQDLPQLKRVLISSVNSLLTDITIKAELSNKR